MCVCVCEHSAYFHLLNIKIMIKTLMLNIRNIISSSEREVVIQLLVENIKTNDKSWINEESILNVIDAFRMAKLVSEPHPIEQMIQISK